METQPYSIFYILVPKGHLSTPFDLGHLIVCTFRDSEGYNSGLKVAYAASNSVVHPWQVTTLGISNGGI
jgi:hypothetical protein